MKMKIVVACDSFKGTLSAAEACRSVACGIREVLPQADIVELPVADGGEGTVDAFVSAGARRMEVDGVADALGRSHRGCYCILPDGVTAVLESAQAVGLNLIAPDERDILAADSRGLARLIDDAVAHACTRIIVGLGGSATNDGGAGMLAGLGYGFLDVDGKQVVTYGGGSLTQIFSVDAGGRREYIPSLDVTIMCDVSAPFCGNQGATHVFARQKGASEADVVLLEKGMCQFADIVRRTTGCDVAAMPGAGAAGGLGGALAAFLNGRIVPGISAVIDALSFDKALDGASLVITGEGSIDRQSLMGKATFGVLGRCRENAVPVIAFAGRVEDRGVLLDAGFRDVVAVEVPAGAKAKALEPTNAFANLRRTASNYMKTTQI